MFPSIVWMVPVKVHHVVRFEIECVVPEAFQKVVIHQTLDIVLTRWNAEDGDTFFQSNPSFQIGKFAAEFSEALAECIACLWLQRCVRTPDVFVAKLASRTHFAINVEKELPSWLHFSEKCFERGTGVRSMVEHAVGNDEVKELVRKRCGHKIGLNDVTIREIGRIFVRGKGRIRNVASENGSSTILRYKSRIEPRSRPNLKHHGLTAIERFQLINMGES